MGRQILAPALAPALRFSDGGVLLAARAIIYKMFDSLCPRRCGLQA